MYFSHSKKFFFVHTVRTGGSSVEKALTPFLPWYLRPAILRRAWSLTPSRRLLGWERVVFIRHGHLTALELKQIVPPELFAGYFKFGFVRNPWDWQVSLYHYVLRRPAHQQHHLIRAFAGFADYIRWKVEMDLRLQKKYFYGANGDCLVDYIGRFETLPQDMTEIARRLDLGKVVLPHINAAERSDWRRYYDDATFELVGKAYAEDVRLFGYGNEELRPASVAA